MIAGTVIVLNSSCVTLNEDVGMLGNLPTVRPRNIGVQELRPTKRTVIVVPGLAPSSIAPPHKRCSTQIALLVGEPPISLARHRIQPYV